MDGDEVYQHASTAFHPIVMASPRQSFAPCKESYARSLRGEGELDTLKT
jgi:hypothetical protein